MMCPILSMHPGAPKTRCEREDCAMWDVERDCCGLRVLAPSEVQQ